MKTFSQKPADVTRQWSLIDAKESTLGRVASAVANRLVGKYQPTYTPHVDSGDYVVVINAAEVGVTGNKLADKKYYRHSGYPGGIKEKNLQTVLADDPAEALRAAVKGMLPRNKLLDNRLARLKIFAGAEHDHHAQKPVSISLQTQTKGVK